MTTGNFNAGKLPCSDAHNVLASYAGECRNTHIQFLLQKLETSASQMAGSLGLYADVTFTLK